MEDGVEVHQSKLDYFGVQICVGSVDVHLDRVDIHLGRVRTNALDNTHVRDFQFLSKTKALETRITFFFIVEHRSTIITLQDGQRMSSRWTWFFRS